MIIDSLEDWEDRVQRDQKNRKKLLQFYNKYWDEFLSKLNCSERAVLSEYKSGSFTLNSLLVVEDAPEPYRRLMKYHVISSKCSVAFIKDVIKQETEKHMEIIKDLENVFLKALKLKNKETVVFRGVRPVQAEDFKNFKEGDLYKPRNFISTSLSLMTAFTFSTGFQDINNPKVGILVKFILPKNTPYILLPGPGGTKYGDAKFFRDAVKGKTFAFDEFELLLNKNSTFRVEKIEKFQIPPSHDYYSKDFERNFFTQIFTLRLVESENTVFNLSSSDVIDSLKFIEISFDEPDNNWFF